MMYLLYGADVVSSRKRLSDIKSHYQSNDIQSFSIKDIDYSSLRVALTSYSLFGETQLLVVEGKLDIKQLGDIDVHTFQTDFLVWVGEKLRSNDSLLSFFKQSEAVIEFFDEKVDITVFPFLDAVSARNRTAALREYSKLVQSGSDPIYLLTMLVWQFRNLIVPENASGFVQKKAVESAKRFSFDDLRRIYYQLLQLDIQMKTGEGVPHALLEQFILKVTR